MKESFAERFDRLADLFHYDTGYIRPGKDSVLNEYSDDENRKVWKIWYAGYQAGVEGLANRLQRSKENP